MQIIKGILDLKRLTDLSNEQCEIILDVAQYLQTIADLSQADIFINCLLEEKNASLVVAEAKPSTTSSLYKKSMLGQIAFEELEPGVLFSLKTGKPIFGSRGITEERGIMQQDIVPIKDLCGKTIAVLIKERDISQVVQNEKNIEQFMEATNSEDKQRVFQTIVVQEIHHRVKNNLQVISGLLRLQMQRSHSIEVAEVFHDSIARISSMALVHDYLAQRGIEDADIKLLVQQISTLLVSSSIIPGQHIAVSVEGESVSCPSDQATAVALIVNELVQNSIKHAFSSKNYGRIDINMRRRKQMVTITVMDDGCGIGDSFSLDDVSSLGLHLVNMLVEERLQGVFSFHLTDKGTKVSITFPIEKNPVEM
ncbi:sensor histidine kinase [Lysinibacillus sp. fls2-241-R2A-57]|uniref:sensor histidine kinase n=1 Tax=Lysinibacillus sp. fls2-241-R2A-57 TaxID=3040292 RepID=UPI0025573420|nr:sensor histidine kinase [Lysinibacillus sp. fls2-241-R2A-57]